MSERSYAIGKALGKRTPMLAVVALVGGLVLGIASRPKAPPTPQATVAPTVNPLIAQCSEGLSSILEETKRLMASKEPEAAHRTVARCKGFTTDAAALALTEETLKAASKVATARAAKLEAERAKAMREVARQAARDEAQLKAAKKKEGVVLGMSMQDALDSSWGRPERVNRTTSLRGTREQWVYGSGNYLYFEDGVLVSIQN